MPQVEHKPPQSDGGKNCSYTVRSSQKETTYYKTGTVAVHKGTTLWLTYVDEYGPAFSHRGDDPPLETAIDSISDIEEALKDKGFGIDWPWYHIHDPEDITVFEIWNANDRWYEEIDTE